MTAQQKPGRKAVLVALVAVLLATVLIALAKRHRPYTLTAYFVDAHGLVPNAAVTVAGVRVGTVSRVREVRDANGARAEVVMTFCCQPRFSLPSSSISVIKQEGILGPPFVSIEGVQSAATPLPSGATLQTKPSSWITNEDAVRRLKEIAATAAQRSQAPVH
jgi:ABC-type transporter Mla subunit MlaD